MKNSVRLVTKVVVARGFTFVLLVILASAFIVLDRNLDRSTEMIWRWTAGISFGGLITSFRFWTKYRDERWKAWRKEVRARGVSREDLLKKMQGCPTGYESYTSHQANVLATLCSMRLFIGASVSLEILKTLSFLEQKGWVKLTINKELLGIPMPSAQPTEQTWAAIDELRPWEWSPEDTQQPEVISTLPPA